MMWDSILKSRYRTDSDIEVDGVKYEVLKVNPRFGYSWKCHETFVNDIRSLLKDKLPDDSDTENLLNKVLPEYNTPEYYEYWWRYNVAIGLIIEDYSVGWFWSPRKYKQLQNEAYRILANYANCLESTMKHQHRLHGLSYYKKNKETYHNQASRASGAATRA